MVADSVQVSIEMQFCYNAPILPLVLLTKKMDPILTRAIGTRKFVAIFALFSFVGNGIM